jgi:hypothetical protein
MSRGSCACSPLALRRTRTARSLPPRVIVELVIALIELRRHPYCASAALAIRDHAGALGLDANWLRVLVGECDKATSHVTEILAPPPAASKPAAARPAAAARAAK